MLRGAQVFVTGMALAAMMIAGSAIAYAQDAAAQPAPEPEKPVLTLDGDAAIFTLLIKPDQTANFEAVLTKVKEALAKNEKPERKQQAAGWKVYKSSQMAQGNAVYIFVIDPVVKDTEYDITRLINEVFPSEVQDMFQKYKDSFAGRAITSMSHFMTMSPQ